jgi:hypothetical protein
MMRHREAWAETVHAPTREEWQRARAEEAAATTTKLEERTVNEAAGEKASEASSTSVSPQSDTPRDVLVVVSKLKSYIKAKSGMNTSDGIIEVLSDHLRRIADQAMESARSDGRKTVLDRDIRPLT